MKTRCVFFILLAAILASCGSDEQKITGTWKVTKYGTAGNYYDVANDSLNIEAGVGYYLEQSEDNTWTCYFTQSGQTHITSQGTWKFAADNTILQLVGTSCNSDHAILELSAKNMVLKTSPGSWQYSCISFSALPPGMEIYFEKQ